MDLTCAVAMQSACLLLQVSGLNSRAYRSLPVMAAGPVSASDTGATRYGTRTATSERKGSLVCWGVAAVGLHIIWNNKRAPIPLQRVGLI
jgi:hypothetical protein